MNPWEFYVTHSVVTEPRKYQGMFENFPQSISEICAIVHGVYLHFVEGKAYGHKIPESRLREINIRYVEEMLDVIFRLDNRPLNEQRSPEKRLVGYCRTAAVLFSSIARQVGIPARHRVGFATYFVETSQERPGSHEIAEVWNSTENRWQLVDPHLDQPMIKKNNISFDPFDVPRDQFLVAGQAWKACRQGKTDPNGYGIGDFRGLPFVRNNMIQDLAALNKMEPLNWDSWGLMQKGVESMNDDEWKLLDQVAKLTGGASSAFEEIRSIYDGSPMLKVPQKIKSYSPVGGPTEVTLQKVKG